MNLKFKESLDFAIIGISPGAIPEVWVTFEELFYSTNLRHWTRIKLNGNRTKESYKLFKKL